MLGGLSEVSLDKHLVWGSALQAFSMEPVISKFWMLVLYLRARSLTGLFPEHAGTEVGVKIYWVKLVLAMPESCIAVPELDSLLTSYQVSC